MQRLSTTVLAVVGTGADECVESFADAANVAAIVSSGESEPADRAREAWGRAVRSHAPFTMHAADPLEPVADAWARSFGDGPVGSLEVAVDEAVARWRAETIGLPDYYVVLDPEALAPDRRHWYLGVLHRAAPHRVVPTSADRAAVVTAIGRLDAGRWWPDLPDLLADIDRAVPDQVMTTARSVRAGGY